MWPDNLVTSLTSSKKLGRRAAAEVVQQRFGHHRLAGDVGVKLAQLEGRVAQPRELLAEHVRRGGVLLGAFEWSVRPRLCSAQTQCERLTRVGMHMRVDRRAVDDD